MGWITQYPADVEADALRFYHLLLDLENEQFAGLGSAQLVELLERLTAYRGVLYARAMQEQQQHPGGRAELAGAERVEASQAVLDSHPDTAGLISWAKVPG